MQPPRGFYDNDNRSMFCHFVASDVEPRSAMFNLHFTSTFTASVWLKSKSIWSSLYHEWHWPWEPEGMSGCWRDEHSFLHWPTLFQFEGHSCSRQHLLASEALLWKGCHQNQGALGACDFFYMDISDLMICPNLNKTIKWFRCLHERLFECSINDSQLHVIAHRSSNVSASTGYKCLLRSLCLWSFKIIKNHSLRGRLLIRVLS